MESFGKIMVVDDSALVRRIICKELQAGGYRTIETGTPEEALNLFLSQRPDLVTMNVQLQSMNGLELCRRMRAAEEASQSDVSGHHLTPVVFITSNDTVRDRELGFEAGATDFLSKPFRPGSLLRMANEILQPAGEYMGANVLVVEDSGVTRRIVTSALERMGVQVFEAADGETGLKIAQDLETSLDLVVTDYLLPGINGDDLCFTLRGMESTRNIPILILSAENEKSAKLHFFRAGATDFLNKPFSIEELQARVKVHLEARVFRRNLERANEELEKDMQLAREVQQASLNPPPTLPHIKSLVYYRPFSLASGDVYDFTVNDDGELSVFLGDATGHGVGVALLTTLLQGALAGLAGADSPDMVLQHLHDKIYPRSGERYITGVHLSIAPNGELQYASAGHPPMVVMKPGGQIELLDGEGGLPLGMLEETLPFTMHTYQLSPGDKLFIYTDGILEWANPDGRQFGMEGFQRVLRHYHREDLHAQVANLMAEANRFSEGHECDDDLTLLALEFNPRGS